MRQFLILIFTLSTVLFAQEKQFKQQQQELQRLYEELRIKQNLEKVRESEINPLMEFYKESAPELLKELQYLKENDLPRYNTELKYLYQDMLMLERIKDTQPDRFKESLEMRRLDGRSRRLSRLYLESKSDDEKEDLVQDLRHTLGQLFELREKERVREMQRISEKLEKLKVETKLRRENKEQIVENRIKELTGQKSVFEW
jgi:hypothetical protein